MYFIILIDKKIIFFLSALQPSEFERRKALCGAISEVLWRAGSGIRCCVCLLQEVSYFGTNWQYRADGITEKVMSVCLVCLSVCLCEVLWRAGSKIRCCVCLLQEVNYFGANWQYRADGITEKVMSVCLVWSGLVWSGLFWSVCLSVCTRGVIEGRQ